MSFFSKGSRSYFEAGREVNICTIGIFGLESAYSRLKGVGMNRLENKVALVSGAARGIGRAVAVRLAEEGAQVIVSGRDPDACMMVVKEINEANGIARFVRLDVCSEDEWKYCTEHIAEEYGTLDILVNNAGITISSAIENTTLSQWRRVMSVNMEGVFLGTKYTIPVMRESGGGSIINLSSVLGITGAAMLSAYTASKAAVRLFTKCAALEYARDHIRVNSIHPAFIHTDMMEETAIRMYGDVEKGKKCFGALHPIGKVGDTADIADGVVYLASEDSSFSSGTELIIDGGFTAV